MRITKLVNKEAHTYELVKGVIKQDCVNKLGRLEDVLHNFGVESELELVCRLCGLDEEETHQYILFATYKMSYLVENDLKGYTKGQLYQKKKYLKQKFIKGACKGLLV